MTDNTFRDFFEIKTTEDKFYEKIDFIHFKKLHEMAKYGDKSKVPVNIDEDDVEFLSQFPKSFWSNALKQRYDMLFDALEKAHGERSGIMEPIQKGIENAIKTGDWDQLKTTGIGDEKISRLRNHYTSLKNNGKNFDPGREAEREAWTIVKPDTDKVDDPEEVDFHFKQRDYDHHTEKHIGSNKGNQITTFVARPFLNRLYHKLERTRGLEHLTGSGLEGKIGQYGYDLHKPVRGPQLFSAKLNTGEDVEVSVNDKKDVPAAVEAKGHNPKDIIKIISQGRLQNHTAGMKFPAAKAIEDRMTDFLNYNGHGVFGDFKNLPKDAVWLNSGNTDRSVLAHLKSVMTRKTEDELRSDKQRYPTEKDVREGAKPLVMEKLIAMAQRGELKGPPVPGKFPEGQPVTVKNGKLVPPPLYLPFQMKKVKVKDKNGAIQLVDKAIPIVNPAHFFRPIGSREEDFLHDGEGKRVYDSSEPGKVKPVMHPELMNSDKLRGYDKGYVRLDNDEYIHGSSDRSAGAFQLNHDTHGRHFLSPGDEGYEEAYEKVFGNEGMGLNMAEIDGSGKNTIIKTSSNGSFYLDILEGIRPCWREGKCSGATSHEGTIIGNNVEEYHDIVKQQMLLNLGDEELWGDTSSAKAKRRKFANIIVGSHAQRDMGAGGGSRRLRIYSQDKNQSLDGSADGKESEFSTQNAILARAQDKPTISDKKGRGIRKFTGGYNLDNFGEIIKLLNIDAKEADAEKVKAREIAKNKTGQDIVDMLSKSISNTTGVMMSVQNLMKSIFQHSGHNPEDSERMAQDQMSSWFDDHKSATELVGVFQQDPRVQEYMKRAGMNPGQNAQPGISSDGTDQPLTPEQKEAVDGLNAGIRKAFDSGQTLETLKPWLLPEKGQQYSKYALSLVSNMARVDVPKILPVLQREINKLYKTPAVPQVATAAKSIQTNPAAPVNSLEQRKQQLDDLRTQAADPNNPNRHRAMLALAHHKDYIHLGKLGRVHQWLKENPHHFSPDEHTAAMSALNNKISSLEGKGAI